MIRTNTLSPALAPGDASGTLHDGASTRDSYSAARLLFGLPALLSAVLVGLVYLFLPEVVTDPDIWWHLRNVREQWSAQTLLHTDQYSYTCLHAAWINHEWLGEVPFFFGWTLAGQRGLWLVTFTTLCFLFLGLFLLTFRKCGNLGISFLYSGAAIFLSTVSFGPRTLLFGWLFLVTELLLLDRMLATPENTQRYAKLLPLLFLVWVNTHGSWLIGFVILLTYIATGYVHGSLGPVTCSRWDAQQRRALNISAALSAAALFVNPYGWRLVLYPFDLAFRQKLNIASVEEWHALDFQSGRGHVFFLLLAVLFLVQVLRPRIWSLYELALLGIGTYAALTHTRFLFLAAILVLPLCAKQLTPRLETRPPSFRPLLNLSIMVVMIASLLALKHPPKDTAEVAASYPTQALAFLHDFHPQGNVFNDYLWGGYLVWNAPQLPVFIDSRVDIFERAGVFKDYLDATRLVNTLDIFSKYRIRYVLFRKDAPLIYLLRNTPGWKVDYEDNTAILLERQAAQR